MIPVVKAHLRNHTGKAKDALLFPAAADSNSHMAPSTPYKVYYPARKAAGRDAEIAKRLSALVSDADVKVER